MTDDAILALVRDPGTREEGFRQLVILYQKRLYQVVRRRLSTHEDADDVLQNTFMKIFKYLGKFEERSELYTWMYRIAINEVINHHKKFRKMVVVEWEDQDSREAEVYFNSEAAIQVLEKIVKQLPDRQQMVFRMRYYDELSYKEMAALLHLSEGALKASFHHAVKKIEEELKNQANRLSEMEEEDELQKEIKDWSPGFPRKSDLPAPQGYFEELPDQLISKWKSEIPGVTSRKLKLLRMTAAAAMISAVCLGIVWWTDNSSGALTAMKISNEDAYQYILENLEEFEPILLDEVISTDPIKTNMPESKAIEEYLLEEMEGGDIESIF